MIMWITLFVFTFQRTVSTMWACSHQQQHVQALPAHKGSPSCPGRCSRTRFQLAKDRPQETRVCIARRLLCAHLRVPCRVLCTAAQVLGHNADPRGRVFSAIWMAAPAVASIAWTILVNAREASRVRLGCT